MAHKQGNRATDDPSKFGLKFDSEKPRWELFPNIELLKILRIFNMFLPSGRSTSSWIDLLKFDREKLINSILANIMQWRDGSTHFNDIKGQRHQLLAIIGFEILFLIRNKPYTKKELELTNSYLRFDLIDMKQIEKVVDVFTMGAKKYADNNWQKVEADRYYGALLRHFTMVRTKEAYDSELGCLHVHQALWNIIALMWLEEKETDEKKPVNKKASKKKTPRKRSS